MAIFHPKLPLAVGAKCDKPRRMEELRRERDRVERAAKADWHESRFRFASIAVRRFEGRSR